MVEQLLDLQAVAGGAVGVPAGTRVHQQRHCARHLAVALIALRVRHARRGLIDLPRMRLQNCSTLSKMMAHLGEAGDVYMLCLQKPERTAAEHP